MYQRPCTGTSLSLPARHLIRKFFCNRLNVQQLHNLLTPLLCRPLVLSLQSHRQQDILLNGQSVQKIVLLENKAQIFSPKFCQAVFCQFRNVQLFIKNVTCCHPVYGGQHIQKCGFSRSRSSHDTHELSPVHCKAHTVYGLRHALPVSVIFFHITYPDIISHICSLPTSLILSTLSNPPGRWYLLSFQPSYNFER